MISPEDRQHLMYIADAINEIESHVQYENFDAFTKDEIAKEAVSRLFQEIGGASKLLSDDFKMQYGDVDWDALIRLEDAMYNQAEETGYEEMWSIIKNDLPNIRNQVTDLAAVLEDEEDIQGTLPPELNLPSEER